MSEGTPTQPASARTNVSGEVSRADDSACEYLANLSMFPTMIRKEEPARQLREPGGIRGASLTSVGAYTPSVRVSNRDLGGLVDSDWIERRTGIRTRSYAGDDEDVVTMAVHAARRALAASGRVPTEVDTVVVATSTSSRLTPSAAAEVATRIGADGAAAFDLSAGCAGFCHALAIAADLIAAGSSNRVVVIGSEKLSCHLDRNDLSTSALFGDGAGAVLVEVSSAFDIGPVTWGSDGSQRDLIRQDPPIGVFLSDPQGRIPTLRMQGSAVYRWARTVLPEVAAQIVAQLDGGVDDLDAFIPHQANARITDAAAARLNLPSSVAIARDIDCSGNTSAASIPLAIHRMLVEGDAVPGDIAALIGFGAGLCWAGQLVRLPRHYAGDLAPEPILQSETRGSAR